MLYDIQSSTDVFKIYMYECRNRQITWINKPLKWKTWNAIREHKRGVYIVTSQYDIVTSQCKPCINFVFTSCLLSIRFLSKGIQYVFAAIREQHGPVSTTSQSLCRWSGRLLVSGSTPSPPWALTFIMFMLQFDEIHIQHLFSMCPSNLGQFTGRKVAWPSGANLSTYCFPSNAYRGTSHS